MSNVTLLYSTVVTV